MAYVTLGELKHDAEFLLNLSEQLFDYKTRLEFEKDSIENMNDHIAKLEEENQRMKDFNNGLEQELQSCKDYIEKVESEASVLDNDKETYVNEIRYAKQNSEIKEKRIQELEYTIIEEKEKFDNTTKELQAKLSQGEKSLQDLTTEFNSLQKTNEKITAMMMSKQKEYTKLTTGSLY